MYKERYVNMQDFNLLKTSSLKNPVGKNIERRRGNSS
jgi:hypothetical protein